MGPVPTYFENRGRGTNLILLNSSNSGRAATGRPQGAAPPILERPPAPRRDPRPAYPCQRPAWFVAAGGRGGREGVSACHLAARREGGLLLSLRPSCNWTRPQGMPCAKAVIGV